MESSKLTCGIIQLESTNVLIIISRSIIVICVVFYCAQTDINNSIELFNKNKNINDI